MRRVAIIVVLAAAAATAQSALAETAAEKQVAQKIGNHLKQSGELQNYRVAVKFQGGVAYLAGSVASTEQRDTAVRLTKQVGGVGRVVCNLQFPTESAPVAKATEQASSDDRQELSAELDRASFEGTQSDAAAVAQAFNATAVPQTAPIQQAVTAPLQTPRTLRQPMRRSNMPVPAGRIGGMGPIRQTSATGVYQAAGSCPTCDGGMGPGMAMGGMGPVPTGFVPSGSGRGPSYDNAQMPGYAWPSYASYPNYAALTYPQQYSPTAWPYIGPFYPYPQVPLAWRKVSLEWDDGWWFLDFSAHNSSH